MPTIGEKVDKLWERLLPETNRRYLKSVHCLPDYPARLAKDFYRELQFLDFCGEIHAEIEREEAQTYILQNAKRWANEEKEYFFTDTYLAKQIEPVWKEWLSEVDKEGGKADALSPNIQSVKETLMFFVSGKAGQQINDCTEEEITGYVKKNIDRYYEEFKKKFSA